MSLFAKLLWPLFLFRCASVKHYHRMALDGLLCWLYWGHGDDNSYRDVINHSN